METALGFREDFFRTTNRLDGPPMPPFMGHHEGPPPVAPDLIIHFQDLLFFIRPEGFGPMAAGSTCSFSGIEANPRVTDLCKIMNFVGFVSELPSWVGQ